MPDVEKCTLRPIVRQYFNISLAIVHAGPVREVGAGRAATSLYSLGDNIGSHFHRDIFMNKSNVPSRLRTGYASENICYSMKLATDTWKIFIQHNGKYGRKPGLHFFYSRSVFCDRFSYLSVVLYTFY